MKYGALLGLLAISSAAVADDAQPVAYFKTVGAWSIAGDPEAGGCAAWSSEATGTKLTVASVPSRETIRFTLQNPAWRSLTDNDRSRLKATFLNGRNQITDEWDLSTISASAANGGPTIYFDIWRAKNDSASFIDQFQKGNELWFWNGTVYVAKFSLKNSSAMIESLLDCRARLRVDQNFDPFAG